MSSSAPVVYLVMCGSPVSAESPAFAQRLVDDGWSVCFITTPMGSRFVDGHALAAISPLPVRSSYKLPHEPDVFPPADAVVVAPATFNTVNKIANGISDTLAVGIACEYLGHGKPVIIAPWANRPLARHGAYRRSLDNLQQDGARLVLTDRSRPGPGPPEIPEKFPWDDVYRESCSVRPAARR